ncbi:hypothetical protein LPIBR_260007 [Lacticaseibacillus paracasei]|nr:hypothetical protein LPIBR_260007 [Lacticaseibacillus paracasei]
MTLISVLNKAVKEKQPYYHKLDLIRV